MATSLTVGRQTSGAATEKYSTRWLIFYFLPLKFNNMVEFKEAGLDSVFHALGDATRRRMLHSLTQGERTVGQLAEPFDMSLAAASKHVKALEGAGLIRREIRGRVHICRLEAGPLATANTWLRAYEQFWNARLDRLESLLRQDGANASSVRTTPAAPPAPRTPSPTKRKRSTR